MVVLILFLPELLFTGHNRFQEYEAAANACHRQKKDSLYFNFLYHNVKLIDKLLYRISLLWNRMTFNKILEQNVNNKYPGQNAKNRSCKRTYHFGHDNILHYEFIL